jgi:nucleotide-binding universal stress UspA family protein
MQRFKNILCVVNTDMQSNVAMDHAAKLAEKNQVGLTVVEVIDEIPHNTTLYERTMSPVALPDPPFSYYKIIRLREPYTRTHGSIVRDQTFLGLQLHQG